jgi:MoaA/NifB/PqqE/SkfB family radical SAM enzyme
MNYAINHVNAEVTRACNLRCGYCFNSSGKRDPNELSTAQWKGVIDHLAPKSMLYTGGEVMTRQDTPKLLAYSIEQGVNTSLLSNGFKIPTLGPLLAQLDRVQISLDSASPRVHDAQRGAGTWRVAREAIDYARNQGTKVEISSVILGDHLDELEGVAALAHMVGASVIVRPVQILGRAEHYMGIGSLTERVAEKKEEIEAVTGPLFIDDFAQYVPTLGEEHDRIVREEGVITVLPDGKIRGTEEHILKEVA